MGLIADIIVQLGRTFSSVSRMPKTGLSGFLALLLLVAMTLLASHALHQLLHRFADTAAPFQALGGGWWNRAELKQEQS
jgi:hypothetical protein